MPTVNLTDRTCAGAKAEPGQRLELWDTNVKGLCLRVSENAKSWVYRYRRPDGTQPRLKLGAYTSGPTDLTDEAGTVRAFTLAGARARARKLRTIIDDGGDPAGDKHKAKAAAKAQPLKTFKDLADAYVGACERGEWRPKGKKKRPRTLADDKAVMRRYVEPVLGKTRVEDVTRATVKKLLRDMVDRGIGAQTNRTHAFIRQAFAFAIAEERVAANPATGFSPMAEIRRRQRVLTDDELRRLWVGLQDPGALRLTKEDGAEGYVYVSRAMAIIVQLAALTLQRKSEVAGMRVAELDLAHKVWLIPGERMKGGWPHLVPLTDRAVELIEEALKLRSTGNAPTVFPSSRDPEKPVRGDSVTHAMRAVCSALELEDATVHDLRRTGSTLMTSERLGIQPFIRSKVLAHRGDTGGGSAVSMLHYDANEYVAEKRKALTAWEGLLLEIVGERARPANVAKLRAERA